ncbi:AtpZ/AtpI family protein [Candidatus Uhrbacteria bacterium]|nr:AtpZ/AtpI family protein [Candidatus Uhrbacteria bacterium]
MVAEEKFSNDRAYLFFALRVMGEISYLIAIPVILLALLGKWLDERFLTAPKFLIAGFALAAFISGYAVWRRAKALGKEYQELEDKEIKL